MLWGKSEIVFELESFSQDVLEKEASFTRKGKKTQKKPKLNLSSVIKKECLTWGL